MQPGWFRWARSEFQEAFSERIAEMRAEIPGIEIYVVLLSMPWKLARVTDEPIVLD